MSLEAGTASSPVDAIRVLTSGEAPIHERSHVVGEAPVTIDITDAGRYTLMCTPTDTRALAVGFAFTEGMIRGVDDIRTLMHCPDDPSVIRMTIASPETAVSDRNLLVSSSCGLCGAEKLERMLQGAMRCANTLVVSIHALVELGRKTRAQQTLFAETGGAHAAAIFDPAGEIVSFAEDIGRHSALDKAIGKCVLSGRAMHGCGAALSGRVSLELVLKAAAAGLEVLSAVSAPSSMGVDAAQQCNITLCGFVRDNRGTVYTHPERIEELR